jgi:hypothetical protein
MPPLFLYATAFLVALTAVAFVLCRRADAETGTQSVREPSAGGPPPAATALHCRAAPLRRSAGSLPQHQAAEASPARAEDALAQQVLRLARQVEELDTERLALREEIRRLNQLVRSTPVQDFAATRSARALRSDADLRSVGA